MNVNYVVGLSRKSLYGVIKNRTLTSPSRSFVVISHSENLDCLRALEPKMRSVPFVNAERVNLVLLGFKQLRVQARMPRVLFEEPFLFFELPYKPALCKIPLNIRSERQD